MEQLPLWNDVRVPKEYYEHYLATDECLNCRMKLRHTMHAFNHFKRHHLNSAKRKSAAANDRQRFYVWHKDKFVEVPVMACVLAQLQGKAVAYTKPTQK